MKLTQRTLTTLKNYASINQSLYVSKGNVLKTISEMKSVMAEVEVQEMFPREFAIYDLNQFLGVVSLFDEPDLDFDTTYVRIKGAQNASSDYFYADKATIRTLPLDKPFQLPDVVETFVVTDKVIKGVLQAANVLQLPEIGIIGDGKDIVIKALNSTNNTSNTFQFNVGSTTKKFKMYFKTDNLKMMMGTYDVSISSKKITQFKMSEGNLTYFIVNEAASVYEG